ncbi:MAG TPA: hypothetical protein H9886_04220 [Candidatus Faecalicoccus intestinipullorum]|nr:hypothetical protein [Candidatus Faecalicoccus intestinipullorum]
MKNKRLSQVLYVFSVVALVYMGYTLFYSYDSITTYYAAYSSQAPVTEIFTSLISSSFTPFCMALIFYALGTIVGLLQGIRNEFEIAANQEEEKNSAENQEEIKAAEEPKEIEENTPSENSAQEEKEELPADKDPDQK